MSSQLTQTQPEYIVRLKDEVDMEHHIQLFHETYSLYKVTDRWAPDFFNAYVGEFHPEVLDALRAHPDVESVSENSEGKRSEMIKQQKNA
ncbi:hypothetical protein BDZ97DRAFT_1914045 [Flammula alnicola]|nr:hypothetical protein BDZ97DRAFT_1914045 [Flammula alnicola]